LLRVELELPLDLAGLLVLPPLLAVVPASRPELSR
jgi:hypothetical protein